MKGLIQLSYGVPADVLRVDDVDLPPIGDDGVLVRIAAASVNALDWHTTRGIPKMIRVTEGRAAPRHRIRGVDLAGTVEAVGRNVTAFRAGDRVFGAADGSFAEYVATKTERLAPLPAGLASEHAATLPVAGLTALQALRDKAKVRRGQRVLIHGAGGGVGSFAVQIAKWMGAHVTAVTRAEHVDHVRSLGADVVVDYGAEDFTRRGDRYDAFIDIGGTRSLADCRRILARSGSIVLTGGPPDRLRRFLGRIVLGLALSPLTGQRVVTFIAKLGSADLALLAQLAEGGHLHPAIDRTYPLHQAADAIAYVGTGKARGKVVIAPMT